MKVDKRTQLEYNFQQIQEKITLLERIERELTTLYEPGFETEISALKKELKNLDEVLVTAARFGLLKSKIQATREQRAARSKEQQSAAKERQREAEEHQREAEALKKAAEARAFKLGREEIKQKILEAEELLQALNQKAQLQGNNEHLKVLAFLWNEIETFNDRLEEGSFSLEAAIEKINELYAKVKIMAVSPAPQATNNDYYGYYKVLDVAITASGEEVKSAYRELIQINHPDRLLGQKIAPAVIKKATQKTAEINEAYEILGNPVKRKSYDFGEYRK